MDEITLLLSALDEAYNHTSWHGANLRGSLKGVSVDQALWRPAPARHNIAELTLHAAFWKCVVRQALQGHTADPFPLSGRNFFARRELSAAAWKTDLSLLDDQHRKLRSALASLDPARLPQPLIRSYPGSFVLRGIVAHDLYHAGQIRLLKRLQRP